MHARHHEVIAVPSPRRCCLTKSSRFKVALVNTYTNINGKLVTKYFCPRYPGPMDINDIPPPPTDELQKPLPLSREATPEPVDYYVPRPAGSGYDCTPIQDRRAVFSDHERKLAKAEARREAVKGSKRGPEKTAAEEKTASEEKAAGKKREQEVYNLFWGISEADA